MSYWIIYVHLFILKIFVGGCVNILIGDKYSISGLNLW